MGVQTARGQIRKRRIATILASGLLLACTAQAQDADQPLSVNGKLRFHAKQIASTGFVAETAAYAGVLHAANTPREWGQHPASYGKRVASAGGATAIRDVFAFVLDSTLREDPRYRRSAGGGFFRRLGHAGWESVVTRTDSGRTRFGISKFGSAIGAAYLSNVWYPDRLNTVASGLEQGAATIGLDFLGNIATEFWPDIKNLFRRR